MLEYRTFYYDPAERCAFRDDGLWRDWAKQYPSLFSQSDVREAASYAPLGFGYHEWLAAIRLHEETGYSCLLAKYQLKGAQPEKYRTFVQLV